MDSKVVDWKVFVALGGTFVLSIFVLKMKRTMSRKSFRHLGFATLRASEAT